MKITTKGIIAIVLFLFLISLSLPSVFASDLTVNSTTTDKDISDWMKSNATVKGDNLIFNTSKYNLNDSINVSKPINIKSNVKTQVSFSKNKNMFNITASGVSFSGLTLSHSGSGSFETLNSIIFANGSSKTINIKDTTFILNGNYMVAVGITNGKGDITNCNIVGKGTYNHGLVAGNWTGKVYKSSFSMEKGFSSSIVVIGKLVANISYTKINLHDGYNSLGIFVGNWVGNLVNSNISSSGSYVYGVLTEKWTGKISGSKIYTNGYGAVGVYSNSSTKATIYKSTVSAKKGNAVIVSKYVKASSSTLVSAKGSPKVYVFGPYVEFYDVTNYGTSRNYYFKITNYGESTSKTSYLIITAKGYKKVVKVKPIKAGKYIKIKVVLPKKYSSSKYIKYAKIQYVDGYGKKVYSINNLKFKF